MTAEFQAGLPRRSPTYQADLEVPPAQRSNPFGWISLGSAIAGFVLPILLAAAFLLLIEKPSTREQAMPLCGLLFLACEGVAFVCGLIGIRSMTGKVGLFFSGASFLLLFCMGLGWFFYASGPSTPAPGPMAPRPVNAPGGN